MIDWRRARIIGFKELRETLRDRKTLVMMILLPLLLYPLLGLWAVDRIFAPGGAAVRWRGWLVAGLVLVRQRPGTASGVVFVTMEDETGVANLIIRPRVFERDRRPARHATVMLARGRIERQGQVVHVMVTQVEDVSFAVTELIARSRDFH